MRYLTLCSGIEAPTLAWKPLGWQAVAFAEVDPFCNAVLAHHYPETPNYGDITKITEKQIKELGPIDLVCGGTPCQGFSVAGLRRGLGDERSNLAIRFCELVAIARPAWLLWENVPGCLSTNGWRDFRRFIRAIADIGYSLAWTVLDAQYFGLAQRRKRVFLIGHLGTDWRYSAAVLFDRESLSGHPAPSRKAGQDIAGSLASCTSDGGGLGTDFDCDGGTVACPLMAKDWHGVHSDMGTFVTHALRADGFDASEDGT